MQAIGKLRLKAVLENVPLAMDFVAQLARGVGFAGRSLDQIQLSVDEACANVVDHAYQDMEPGDMEIECTFDGQHFTMYVRDWGKSFDPDSVQEPDVTAPLERRTLGGLGLFIIRQVMDCVRYSSDPAQGNELAMAKRLEAEG